VTGESVRDSNDVAAVFYRQHINIIRQEVGLYIAKYSPEKCGVCLHHGVNGPEIGVGTIDELAISMRERCEPGSGLQILLGSLQRQITVHAPLEYVAKTMGITTKNVVTVPVYIWVVSPDGSMCVIGVCFYYPKDFKKSY
jgi:hypothetical protein